MLNDLDCMTLRRIQTEQSCSPFESLGHEHASRNVPVPESLALKRHLELVEPHQLQGKRALQVPLAVKLNRVAIEGRIHLVDAAVVRPGNGVHALVDEFVLIHGATSEVVTPDAKLALSGFAQNLHAQDFNPRRGE
jgi:hypothetical protein